MHLTSLNKSPISFKTLLKVILGDFEELKLPKVTKSDLSVYLVGKEKVTIKCLFSRNYKDGHLFYPNFFIPA